MATDFTTFSRHHKKTSPLDCDVKVIHAHLRRVVSTEDNTMVPIPWEGVRLVRSVAIVTEAVNAVAWEIDLELNAAGGTEMMTMSVAKSSAVGAIFEASVTTQSACERLSAKEGTRDAINIESNAAAGTPTGAVNIYMMFEPEMV